MEGADESRCVDGDFESWAVLSFERITQFLRQLM